MAEAKEVSSFRMNGHHLSSSSSCSSSSSPSPPPSPILLSSSPSLVEGTEEIILLRNKPTFPRPIQKLFSFASSLPPSLLDFVVSGKTRRQEENYVQWRIDRAIWQETPLLASHHGVDVRLSPSGRSLVYPNVVCKSSSSSSKEEGVLKEEEEREEEEETHQYRTMDLNVGLPHWINQQSDNSQLPHLHPSPSSSSSSSSSPPLSSDLPVGAGLPPSSDFAKLNGNGIANGNGNGNGIAFSNGNGIAFSNGNGIENGKGHGKEFLNGNGFSSRKMNGIAFRESKEEEEEEEGIKREIMKEGHKKSRERVEEEEEEEEEGREERILKLQRKLESAYEALQRREKMEDYGDGINFFQLSPPQQQPQKKEKESREKEEEEWKRRKEERKREEEEERNLSIVSLYFVHEGIVHLDEFLHSFLIRLLRRVEDSIVYWEERTSARSLRPTGWFLNMSRKYWYLHECSPLFYWRLGSSALSRIREERREKERKEGGGERGGEGEERRGGVKRGGEEGGDTSQQQQQSEGMELLYRVFNWDHQRFVEKNLSYLREIQKEGFVYLGWSSFLMSQFKSIRKQKDSVPLFVSLVKQHLSALKKFLHFLRYVLVQGRKGDSFDRPEWETFSKQQEKRKRKNGRERRRERGVEKEKEEDVGDCVEIEEVLILMRDLLGCLSGLLEVLPQLDGVLHRICRPGFVSRNWTKGLLLCGGAYLGYKMGQKWYQPAQTTLVDFFGSARTFFDSYVRGRLVDVYQTIRYDKHDLKLMDSSSVIATEDSLLRMVLDLVKERNPEISSQEIEEIKKVVSLGDLSAIMPMYEDNLKTPIKGLFFGDLVRLALIQVQKQKMDLERALIAIDQLMRSNELLFKIIAAVPGVSFFFFLSSNLFGLSGRRNREYSYRMIKGGLLELEKLLTISFQNPTPSFYLLEGERREREREEREIEAYGRFLTLMTSVYSHSFGIPSSLQKNFFADLSLLSDESLSPQARLASISRMYNTYQFLSLKF